MANTIKTPLGTITKKQAWIGGGIAAVVFFVVVYRARQNTANEAEPQIYDAEINPATGYPYGSPEDAAALSAQMAYQYPSGGGGGGGGSPSAGEGFTNNAQWSQAVIQYMVDNGLVEDAAMLTQALGKYLTGKAVTDAEESLISQAIAVEGKPPLSGADGYPPSIRKLPTGSTPTGVTLTAPTGYKATYVSSLTVAFRWTAVPGAEYYEVQSTRPPTAVYITRTPEIAVYPLLASTAYHWHIRAVGANGVRGPWTPEYQITTQKPGSTPYKA